MRTAVALVCTTLIACAIRAQNPDQQTFPRFVVIAGSYRDFHEALAHAKKLSRESRLEYSDEGRVFDKKRGWILPDDDEDKAWAGEYVARRYNSLDAAHHDEPFISVERSDAYSGFAPGFYIVVAGIYANSREATPTVEKLRPLVRDAYAKRTEIYLGCMH